MAMKNLKNYNKCSQDMTQFLKLNAYSVLEMFKEDLLDDVKYYILNGGLSQLINKLENILEESDRVKIMKNENFKRSSR